MTGFKPLDELTLMDDYMFGVIMQDTRFLKPLLEAVLGVGIRAISFIEPQKSLKEGYASRGVRLDLYVTDETGAVYNVEVQTTSRQNLPKRMRYYQSAIDINVLTPGADYSRLCKSYIIFICNYDPYGRSRYIYRFENRCIDEPELVMGDETVKIIVNTRGTEGAVSEGMKEIIRYLGDGSIGGAYTQELEEAIRRVKASEERRHEYMVMLIHDQEMKNLGREEGIGIGREEGIGIGREQGMLAILSDLVKSNLLSPAEAAKRVNMSESEFLDRVAAPEG